MHVENRLESYHETPKKRENRAGLLGLVAFSSKFATFAALVRRSAGRADLSHFTNFKQAKCINKTGLQSVEGERNGVGFHTVQDDLVL